MGNAQQGSLAPLELTHLHHVPWEHGARMLHLQLVCLVQEENIAMKSQLIHKLSLLSPNFVIQGTIVHQELLHPSLQMESLEIFVKQVITVQKARQHRFNAWLEVMNQELAQTLAKSVPLDITAQLVHLKQFNVFLVIAQRVPPLQLYALMVLTLTQLC